MHFFYLGGWVMWPLLGLSVLALAVICERTLFYLSLGFPQPGMDKKIAAALSLRDISAVKTLLPEGSPVFAPFFQELIAPPSPEKNDVLSLLAEEIMARLEKNLSVLSVIVRAAPLLGLLGTILGMINTFSRLAATQGGVDLSVLAEGIWQALLTTAAGLLIAIPVLLALHAFQGRCRRTCKALHRLAASLVVLETGRNGQDHD